MEILITVSIFFFLCGFFFFAKGKNIHINNTLLIEERDQLININKKLISDRSLIEDNIRTLAEEKNSLEKKKNIVIQELENTRAIVEQEYIDKKKHIDEELEAYKETTGYAAGQYLDSLEKQYEIAEQDYFEKIKSIDYQIQEKNLELEKIKNTLSASQKAQLRELEKEQKEKFYQIQIEKSAIKEIQIISDIEYLLSDPRPIRMLIWTTYYSKKVNELCSRVLGSDNVCGIYKITNTQTKQIYIGQAKNIKERWREHCKCGLGIDTPANNKLYESMKKDNLISFTFELLETCEITELNEKEKFYIDLYKSYDYGLNSTKGNNK